MSKPRVRFRLLAARALWPSWRLLNKLNDKIVTGRLNVITRSKKLKHKVFQLRSAPTKPQVLPSLCNPVWTCHREWPFCDFSVLERSDDWRCTRSLGQTREPRQMCICIIFIYTYMYIYQCAYTSPVCQIWRSIHPRQFASIRSMGAGCKPWAGAPKLLTDRIIRQVRQRDRPMVQHSVWLTAPPRLCSES